MLPKRQPVVSTRRASTRLRAVTRRAALPLCFSRVSRHTAVRAFRSPCRACQANSGPSHASTGRAASDSATGGRSAGTQRNSCQPGSWAVVCRPSTSTPTIIAAPTRMGCLIGISGHGSALCRSGRGSGYRRPCPMGRRRGAGLTLDMPGGGAGVPYVTGSARGNRQSGCAAEPRSCRRDLRLSVRPRTGAGQVEWQQERIQPKRSTQADDDPDITYTGQRPLVADAGTAAEIRRQR